MSFTKFCDQYFDPETSIQTLQIHIEKKHMCFACNQIGDLDFHNNHLCEIKPPLPIPQSTQFKFTVWKKLEDYTNLPEFRN